MVPRRAADGHFTSRFTIPVRMKRSLRKTAAQIHVSYAGTYSNNLFADNFTLEDDQGVLTLGIDLSRNLRTRNKSTNTYIDAEDLAARHQELESVQIDDGQVFRHLGANLVATTLQRQQRPALRLSVSFGDRGTFVYPVAMELLPRGGARLIVQRRA